MLLASVIAVSACSSQPRVLEQTDINILEPNKVYVVRQGLHTGFVLPANTVQSRFPQVYADVEGSPFIEFGWGDTDYYQSDEVTFGMTVKALFWPTHPVVRVVAIPERPDVHFTDNELEVLCFDQEQYSLLVAFISQSFLRNDEGHVIKTMDSADGNSQFYKAEGRYSVWNTCNTWTAKGLKSTGWNISPVFKVTPGSVMSNLARNNAVSTTSVCETVLTAPVAKSEAN